MRLRPDGAKGLLVSTLASFSDYQRERAWTWEHQALVRARGCAGDTSLLSAFEQVRSATLSRPRDLQKLREDVIAMRMRMRAELDRSDAARFDLKQGEGGLVDLEFLLQFLVLRDSQKHAALLLPRDTAGLIAAVHAIRLLEEADSKALLDAHALLLSLGLACTLDRRQRLVQDDATLMPARTAIRNAVGACGLDFAAPL